MPKKKPIDKRLNKLFDNLKQEEPEAKSAKTRKPKVAPLDKKSVPAASKTAVKHTPTASPEIGTITQTDSALALAFQTGPDTWSTVNRPAYACS